MTIYYKIEITEEEMQLLNISMNTSILFLSDMINKEGKQKLVDLRDYLDRVRLFDNNSETIQRDKQ